MINFIVLNKAHTGFPMEQGLQKSVYIAVVLKIAKKYNMYVSTNS